MYPYNIASWVKILSCEVGLITNTFFPVQLEEKTEKMIIFYHINLFMIR